MLIICLKFGLFWYVCLTPFLFHAISTRWIIKCSNNILLRFPQNFLNTQLTGMSAFRNTHQIMRYAFGSFLILLTHWCQFLWMFIASSIVLVPKNSCSKKSLFVQKKKKNLLLLNSYKQFFWFFGLKLRTCNVDVFITQAEFRAWKNAQNFYSGTFKRHQG